jgi:hypothetical protein
MIFNDSVAIAEEVFTRSASTGDRKNKNDMSFYFFGNILYMTYIYIRPRYERLRHHFLLYIKIDNFLHNLRILHKINR